MKFARNESISRKHPYVGTEHLLVGLLLEDSGIAAAVLRQAGLKIEDVRKQIKPSDDESQIAANAIPFSPNVRDALEAAVISASNLHHNYIGTEHLLLGILANNQNTASQIMESLKIDISAVEMSTTDLMGSKTKEDKQDKKEQPDTKKSYNAPKKDKTALSQFGRDLTLLAYEGKLDPVIGREVEIERAILVLARRTKNNPLLLGEPGVGKTAIVEGIAQKIIQGEVPDTLKDHRLVALDLPGIVAGTKYRGQFEERIKSIMVEASKEPVVLFIDEIHTMIGAGGAEGAIDAANVLKPALSRGEIRCLGATTLDEYRKSIEKDGALARRFQPIIVDPPTTSQTLEILKGLQAKYEQFHNVKYDADALDAAVFMSDRFITGRFLPDKAIDVIDEAGARVVMETLRPKEITDIEKKISDMEAYKLQAVADNKFEEAASIRDTIEKLKSKLLSTRNKLNKAKKVQTVTKEIVAITISKITGVPLTSISSSEADKLLSLEKELGNVVIGQNKAKKTLAKALRKARAGLKDPKRPIGVFLFLGPTGVGKTLLVKAMAKTLLGSDDSLITFDMSEYMEKHNVSRMIGASPGYVGYEDGGQLTEAVRRKPYSVILFDEIEKAHPQVYDIFLQIMEEGKLTDSTGRIVDFKNTIVVLTSNVGSQVIQNKSPLGFNTSVSNQDLMEDQINGELEKHFKPEFINRLDEKVIFSQLTKEELREVLHLEVAKVHKLLADKQISISLTAAAEDFLLEKGWNPEMGARPLRRAVSTFIEDCIADEMLKNPDTKRFVLDVCSEQEILVVQDQPLHS